MLSKTKLYQCRDCGVRRIMSVLDERSAVGCPSCRDGLMRPASPDPYDRDARATGARA